MSVRRVHLVAIGGISMRALAMYLQEQGFKVSGCDVAPFDLPGVPVARGHDPAHLRDIDEVIINSAITPSAPGWVEVVEAQRRRLPVRKRAAVLGELTEGQQTITVAGTHGKSTTTGMVAQILTKAGVDPRVFIGTTVALYGGMSYRPGHGPLVMEADEFDRSFLSFASDVAVITNIEADHLDYYSGGLPEITAAFGDFLAKRKTEARVIVPSQDTAVWQAVSAAGVAKEKVITYGLDPGADYQVTDAATPGKQNNHFTIRTPDGPFAIDLPLPGRHNQLNSAAAFACARTLDILPEAAQAALADFRGLSRRFEILVDQPGFTLITDYGHHPTELAATIAAARQWYPKRRLVAVFQPHQHSRTRLFMREFADALSRADQAVVTDVYAVAGREEEHLVRVENLAARIRTLADAPGIYLPLAELTGSLGERLLPGDLVLFLGAGPDIDQAARLFASHHR